MGLKQSGGAIFLGIYEGKLVRRYKTPTADSIQRTNKEGNVVNETFHKAVEGKIVGLDVKTHKDYGERLLLYISDDTIYCIEMKLDSRYASNFLKTLPNVNLSLPVEFIPNKKTDANGKDDYTVFLKQNNVTLKRFYKKDDGVLPEPTVKPGKRGKPDVWDFATVNDFLYEAVVVPFRDTLKAISAFDIPAEAGIPGDSDISEE